MVWLLNVELRPWLLTFPLKSAFFSEKNAPLNDRNTSFEWYLIRFLFFSCLFFLFHDSGYTHYTSALYWSGETGKILSWFSCFFLFLFWKGWFNSFFIVLCMYVIVNKGKVDSMKSHLLIAHKQLSIIVLST